MYNYVEIDPQIYYVGVNDHRLQRFENMFPLKDGVSYNSYLIRDEKTCLIDAVDESSTIQFLNNIKAALQGRDLDYLLVQHMEPDHCGAIEILLQLYPNAKMLGNQKTFDLFEQFYPSRLHERYQLITEGERLALGQRTLRFIMAPMVHWPEVFVTYEENSGVLFSADAFGSFRALHGNLYADEVNYAEEWLAENRRYYVNIVGKHGQAVQRLFNKLADLKINLICPLHGLLFRGESLQMIMEKYQHWSSFQPEEKGIVLVYSSMYGNTERALERLAFKLGARGVKNIQLYDVSQTQASYIIADLWRYSHAVFACINYNTELYFIMDSLLRELLAINYQNRKVALLYNMSWGGRALQQAQEILCKGKNLSYVAEPFTLKSSLRAEQEADLDAWADQLLQSLQE